MSYIIEDNVDFFNMLNNDVDEILQQNDNICLISNTIIDKTSSIKLQCGHEFNYLPLFKEIIEQKVRHSVLEVVKLKDFQIKCPYCRNVQNKLIPYIKMKGVRKMSKVNHPAIFTMCENTCKYTFKSGKRKGKVCDSLCYLGYCNTHMKSEPTNDATSTNIINYSSMKLKNLRIIAKENSISKYYIMKKSLLIKEIEKCMNDKNNDTK
jgi:hypothetical protein